MENIDDALPASVALEMRFVPVRELAGVLILAADTKVTAENHERIEYILNRKVCFVYRSRDWMEAELDRRYRSGSDANDTSPESCSASWYWPKWHYLDGDTLVVKASGWEGMTHWTGAGEFPVDHPDRAFWDWLVTIPQYGGRLDERKIPQIKRIWNRYRRRVTQAANPPARPSGDPSASGSD